MIRIGRLQLSLEGIVLVAALMVAASWLGSWGGRADGARAARLQQLEQERDSLRKLGARVDTVWQIQRDTFYVRRARVDTLTRTVEHWKHDTLRVVEYVQQADSAIRACSALVVTCEQRAALYQAETRTLQRQVTLLEQGTARAWTAAGLSYDPATGDVGAWVDRDLWRIRGGVGVTPARDGLRAELRAGWRW